MHFVYISRRLALLLQVTATHQLESAVTTLALCTRPILLASPATGSAEADAMELDDVPLGTAHVGQLAAGRAAIADALMHTLPGIDANDPPKTLATLQFYASVLSSVSHGFAHACSSMFPWFWTGTGE